MSRVVIIGGGASGMAAAIQAAKNKDNRVFLIERQSRVGRKLLSTGNGRCNLTNSMASVKDYHGENPDFAGNVLSVWRPGRVLDFFYSLGLMTEEEYGGRLFPMSGQASSVVDVLRYALEKPNINLMAGETVTSVRKTTQGFVVKTDASSYECEKVIVACGGCAGAKLGGVKDGYGILSSLGHSVTELRPSLTRISTDSAFPRALKGIRADAGVKIIKDSNIIASNRGDVLFTDTGVSGTAVFEISRYASSGSGLALSLDFFPAVTTADLKIWLRERAREAGERPANTVFAGSVHTRLGQMICKYSRVGGERPCSSITEADIKSLVANAKGFRLRITGTGSFDDAQVTAGGVRTAEFNPETMESKIVPGLYACGEVLDIDGDCGGFNLHWAWGSGLTAGELR